MKYTILVNKNNPIKTNYLNKVNLIEIKNVFDETIKIEAETYKNYLELEKHLKEKGIVIGIDSAYRSFADQENLIKEFENKYGKEYTDKTVARVGESEHHTGLAIDLVVKVNNEWLEPNDKQEKTESILKEVHKYLHNYGFILRYPKEKESITSYDYESWHIRYVGKVPAKIIYEEKLTLEEYLKDFSGVLYINKQKGITSFDVVNEISHLFGIKRVGHTGTLDPLAEGVLIIAIGKATKIVELLTAEDKEYIAGVKLGFKTDTYDIEGKVLARKEVPCNINVEEVLKSFQKTYLQEVPIYSAVKVNGKKLYDYARENKEVKLPKKEVTIKEIELLEQKENSFIFKSLVTKGCYIRSLINDIGKSLNTYATMTSLIRTKQGEVKLEDTNTFEDIKNNNYRIYKIEEVLSYPEVIVSEELAFKISNGVEIEDKWQIKDKVIFKDKKNNLLAIYQKIDESLVTWKGFL
ncbi:MAG: tRNA pseudouridine(55) synthase TruB [Bacilli bacterium]|nr:tRNA pseudouridine(55) synthase TruB [Bacilli bacterium]